MQTQKEAWPFDESSILGWELVDMVVMVRTGAMLPNAFILLEITLN